MSGTSSDRLAGAASAAISATRRSVTLRIESLLWRSRASLPRRRRRRQSKAPAIARVRSPSRPARKGLRRDAGLRSGDAAALTRPVLLAQVLLQDLAARVARQRLHELDGAGALVATELTAAVGEERLGRRRRAGPQHDDRLHRL